MQFTTANGAGGPCGYYAYYTWAGTSDYGILDIFTDNAIVPTATAFTFAAIAALAF